MSCCSASSTTCSSVSRMMRMLIGETIFEGEEQLLESIGASSSHDSHVMSLRGPCSFSSRDTSRSASSRVGEHIVAASASVTSRSASARVGEKRSGDVGGGGGDVSASRQPSITSSRRLNPGECMHASSAPRAARTRSSAAASSVESASGESQRLVECELVWGVSVGGIFSSTAFCLPFVFFLRRKLGRPKLNAFGTLPRIVIAPQCRTGLKDCLFQTLRFSFLPVKLSVKDAPWARPGG